MLIFSKQHTVLIPFQITQEQLDEVVASIREQVAARGISELTEITNEAIQGLVDEICDADDLNLALHDDAYRLVSGQIEDLEAQEAEYESQQPEIVVPE